VNDYTVRLAHVFQGPLDLLLHLVREQEVEIQDIEISKILDGYLAYLESFERLDIEYAGDFLVMAATLMAIKSRSLLPHEELDLEDELDPKDELIQRLIEYRRFKEAADGLDEARRERALMLERGWHGEVEAVAERELELGELTAWDLLAAFSRLMRETMADRPHVVSADPRPLRYYVNEVVRRLRTESSLTLRGLVDTFEGLPVREALVGSFCALLELVRLELVKVRQRSHRDDIEIAIDAARAESIDDVVREAIFDDGRAAAAEAAEPEPAPEASS
jgi:segregation and condensation protein A